MVAKKKSRKKPKVEPNLDKLDEKHKISPEKFKELKSKWEKNLKESKSKPNTWRAHTNKPKNMTSTGFETWKDRRKRIVIRNNGKLVTWRFLKGSGIKTKRKAKSIFTSNNTLYKDRYKRRTTNFSETTQFQDARKYSDVQGKPITAPPTSDSQYIVSGLYVGEGRKVPVHGRSRRRFAIKGLPLTREEQVEQAWENFLSQLGQIESGGDYDADEGLSVYATNKVIDVTEGWVYFKPVKRSSNIDHISIPQKSGTLSVVNA